MEEEEERLHKPIGKNERYNIKLWKCTVADGGKYIGLESPEGVGGKASAAELGNFSNFAARKKKELSFSV